LNHHLINFERDPKKYDLETVRAIVNLRRKINLLMIEKCFVLEEDYCPISDVPVKQCKLLVDSQDKRKIYLPHGYLQDYIEKLLIKAVSMAKTVSSDVVLDDLTE